jgi:PhnB protein
MASKVKPVPDGYHTATPYMIVQGGAQAIDFYKKAFGAEERFRMPGPDGKLMHAEIQIGNSIIMLGDECPEMGARSPQALGGSGVGLFLYVADVDAAFKRAVDAGATAKQPPTDMFWGDRYCKLSDPFGHEWSIGTHIEDVSPEEIDRRGKKWMEEMAQQHKK